MHLLVSSLWWTLAVNGALHLFANEAHVVDSQDIAPKRVLDVGQHHLVHPAKVRSFDITDDGRRIATGCGLAPYKGWVEHKSMPCELRVWDGRTGQGDCTINQ